MKNWEEAGLLTDLLDRHTERSVRATKASDWTIYWFIPPLLRLLHEEPTLVQVLNDYLAEADRIGDVRVRLCRKLVESASTLLSAHRGALDKVKGRIPPDKVDGLGIAALPVNLAAVEQVPEDHARIGQVLEAIRHWVAFGYDPAREEWLDPQLAEASVRIDLLRNGLKRILKRCERVEASHPGYAYLRLQERLKTVDFAATDDPLADEVHNRRAAKFDEWMRQAHEWAPTEEDLPQPRVIAIQKDVQTLHLGFVTALARGRSRWAIVKRFGARCVAFDREHLLAEVAKATGGAEAVLTLTLARYLFDAGFNPLVDAAACRLRPDALDATTNPAVYVEAKQYEDVSNATVRDVRNAINQAVNTWERLTQRWYVPEAFVVLFRRSGRPLRIENDEVRCTRGRLYVLVVDLGESSESGSRAADPVTIDIQALLNVGATPSAPEDRPRRAESRGQRRAENNAPSGTKPQKKRKRHG